jgi:hypothetical protein
MSDYDELDCRFALVHGSEDILGVLRFLGDGQTVCICGVRQEAAVGKSGDRNATAEGIEKIPDKPDRVGVRGVSIVCMDECERMCGCKNLFSV